MTSIILAHESEEQWRPVPGFEGLYEVSNVGRIRSIDRKVHTSHGQIRTYKGKVLQSGKHSVTDHRQIILRADGRRRTYKVHRLVLMAFVGPCPDGMEVCHNNGVPDDNRLENLRYGTRAENVKDRVLHGVYRNGNTRKIVGDCGHLLERPNLVEAKLPKQRNCKACENARREVCRHPERKPIQREIANQKYRKYMGAK